MNLNESEFQLSCPIPKSDYDKILLAHGGGGKLSNQLIQKLFISQFDNEFLNVQHDGAVFEINGTKFAFTTDSYVIQPIFFPGGDIGELAIYGTVNDLAMCGAKPLYISVGLIIEEGFAIDELWKITLSLKNASEKSGVKIITGDTKVVDKGKGDKIFINTSGLGIVYEGVNVSPKNCKAGDVIILSGRIAEHGIAIMSAREGIEFETTIQSDTAPLNDLVENIFSVSKKVHVLRDPTRGGLASAFNEIAASANVGIYIDENKIPILEQVKAVCELLGFDPLYVANEGKLIAIVEAEDSEKILQAMRSHPLGTESQIIGEVVSSHPKRVVMKTSIGSQRIVDMISGEQLPRIC
ncbi:MAG: hydrogenase expression/formation protein HypE [Ignavibacteria bacterium]|nr:hydrogenase expression/formation protein HypE [Ignavibacteria bacterium]